MTQQDPLHSQYELLKQQIAQIGFICTGSVMSVHQKCGSPTCACAHDPSARHGPYNRWTRKEKGKTVTRTLNETQAAACRRCIENQRRLEEILVQMRRLSVQFIEKLK